MEHKQNMNTTEMKMLDQDVYRGNYLRPHKKLNNPSEITRQTTQPNKHVHYQKMNFSLY